MVIDGWDKSDVVKSDVDKSTGGQGSSGKSGHQRAREKLDRWGWLQ